jgi:hypothetical protein
MKRIISIGASAVIAVSALAIAPSAPAQAEAAIPVVELSVNGTQATISQSTMRPGVVEFHVTKSYLIPGDQGGPDALTIMRTDHHDQVLATLQTVFPADPAKPETLAPAAQGMRTVHALATVYGGAIKGGVWQVSLPAGNYYALGIQSTVMGRAQPVAFTVAGTPRVAAMHPVQAAFWATGPVGNNDWHFAQLGRQPVQWFAFRNAAHEIHFLSLTGVTMSAASSDVKKIFSGQETGDPKWITGPFVNFDVISPGVRVAIQQPLAPGRYLVDCFIPSEADGMPHALMGMWKLINVR